MVDIPGNSSTTSTITVGGSVSGAFEVAGDHDWYRIQLTSGQTITVNLSAITSGLDTYVRIRDASGNIIFENDDAGGSLNSRVSFAAPSSGTFYIDVGTYNDEGQGNYQLSVQTFVPPPFGTLDQIADQLVNGYWGGNDHRFMGTNVTVNLTGLNATGMNYARQALALWSDVIGVNFVEVSSGGQIRFDDDGDGASTSADYTGGSIISADVNISTQWLIDYAGDGLDSYAFQTYIHEIGHALGLGHAGDYNGDATFPYDALFINDAWSTSIMSYFDPSESSYFSSRGFSRDYSVSPMQADIVAMQALYGLSTTTRTGDTTYGFNSNAGRSIYDATRYVSVAYTIIDSGGTDTLDYSGFSATQIINLNSEQYSDIGGRVGNVSIARGTIIENALGGSGADTIYGNIYNNFIVGNGGADILNGGLGHDTLRGGSGQDILTGGFGNDVFTGIGAEFNGDTIVDFSAGDWIVFENTSLSSLSLIQTGTGMSYAGGTITMNAVVGNLVAVGGSLSSTQIGYRAINDEVGDFNGDGRADVLLRNTNGTVTNWLGQTNGGFFSNHAVSTYTPDVSWQFTGTGDYNGDGRSDLLLRHSSGLIINWLGAADGSFVSNHENAIYGLDLSWHVVATGDFNGDGRDDLALRHENGTVINWLGQANGGFFSNHAAATYGLDTGWRVLGSGDFNGDGRDDLLLRHNNGTVNTWLGEAEGRYFSNHAVGTYALDSAWQVAAIGDFNGDGRSDLLLRHHNGTVTEWLGQTGGTFFSNHAVATYFLDPSWQIASSGDFNGDGRDDLLLQHTNGTITDWLGQANGGFFSNHVGATYAVHAQWVAGPDIMF